MQQARQLRAGPGHAHGPAQVQPLEEVVLQLRTHASRAWTRRSLAKCKPKAARIQGAVPARARESDRASGPGRGGRRAPGCSCPGRTGGLAGRRTTRTSRRCWRRACGGSSRCRACPDRVRRGPPCPSLRAAGRPRVAYTRPPLPATSSSR